MKILLISPYPNNFDKSRSIFVYRLMQSLTKLGCNIVVISPENWRSKYQEYYSPPGVKKYGSETAIVYRPKYFDFPNRIKLGSSSMGKYNAVTYKNAVRRVIRKLDFKPDIIYAHFLYRSGPAAIMASKYYKAPAVVALGESSLDKHVGIFTLKSMKDLIAQFSGIISVSEKNKNYCVEKLDVNSCNIRVFPNSVDPEIFYPRNTKEMRDKYKLPQDKFIVAFTGHFIERKGPLRVLDAINGMDRNVGGIFIGSGSQEPMGEKVLFKGRVAHNQVPELLSAADIFVLPTKNEGSCNAIAEAMACGLPIVSSDIEAIKEQVNQENGILCDPENVREIKNAIQTLYADRELLEKKRDSALGTSKSSSLESRAKGIWAFLKEQI